MKVAIVSAHYPPNFVSGGTLQPQRIARGIRARGHDVRVYAGFLDLDGTAGRAPLDTWDDVDEEGVPVRWIVTTPFIGWSDRENFANPAVSTAFGAWLDETQPEIVHFHSLQSLGAGVLTEAKRRGLRVVVTMHDFWWCCARQFLVDRSFQPCCLVVDAGVCECEVDRAWLTARNAHLLEQLRAADVVLAPSATAAQVLQANGIRASVDENGFDDIDGAGSLDTEPTPRADPVIRFGYTGGADEMKGVDVLFAAIASLADLEGWTMRAYGAAPFVQRTGARIAAQVELLDAFPPSALDTVLADIDVLVLPSVMRESHSLITREALSRGVPVLTTDSLGPEEVVIDGRNGIIVPAADPAALALAMRRLVEDPSLVDHLARGCRTDRVPIRPLRAQLDHLEEIYRAAPSPPSARRSIDCAVFMVGIDGSPLRYRGHLPAEALALAGVETEVHHYRDAELPAAVERADVLCVYRVPATIQVLELIDRAHQRGIPVMFDVDDLIFDPQLESEIPALRLLPPDESALWLQGVRRYRTTMEHCDAFIGSTDPLVQHAAAVTGLPVHRFENGVGILTARLSDTAVRRPRRPGPLRIGYLSGTTTHDEDYYLVEPALARVLEARPDVELWLTGHLPEPRALGQHADRVRRIEFRPWQELPSLLRDLDVNLAPLTPGSRFNESKSAIKWLEAALVGTPTVASPTQPFRQAVTDGVNGLLATTIDDWHDAIDRLLGDELLRRRIGARARRDALLTWSPHLQAQRYLDILSSAVIAPPRPSSWVDVVLDEPLGSFPLEPYAVDATPPTATRPTTPSKRYVARLRTAVAERGLVGAAVHIGRKLVGRPQSG